MGNIVPVHTPIPASWLNQAEIYFSVVQHKVLNDFDSLLAVKDRLIRFQTYYETIAKPFEWKFTLLDDERGRKRRGLFEATDKELAKISQEWPATKRNY
jgi:hypothetical protein